MPVGRNCLNALVTRVNAVERPIRAVRVFPLERVKRDDAVMHLNLTATAVMSILATVVPFVHCGRMAVDRLEQSVEACALRLALRADCESFHVIPLIACRAPSPDHFSIYRYRQDASGILVYTKIIYVVHLMNAQAQRQNPSCAYPPPAHA